VLGKPEGKRPLGRPRRRWQDNVKMHMKEIGGRVWTGFIWFMTGPDKPSAFIKGSDFLH
jgi:hypothetical protein